MTLRFLTHLVVLSFMASVAVAEDAQNKPAAQAFAAIHQQWRKLDDELAVLFSEFLKPTTERRTELLDEFKVLTERARKLMPELRTSAVAAYTESPGEDTVVTEVIVNLAAVDVSQDDYKSAAELVELLSENKSTNKDLLNLAGVVAFCTHDFEAAAIYFRRAANAGSLTEDGKRYQGIIEREEILKHWNEESQIRALEAESDDLPRVKLETTKGDIVLELFENEAPKTVGNFISLVEGKFYDGLTFHRVLAGFMAQGGCPEGTGTGGPGYTILCECYEEGYRRHFAGSLSGAHAGRDTGGSQFFLTFRPTPHLDGEHTVFGRVVEGFDVLAKLQKINPDSNAADTKPDRIAKATVLRKRNHQYAPTKVAP